VERCKLPQRGLGRTSSRNRSCCILALKYGILVATVLMIFPRIKLTKFRDLNSIKANRDHAFFCSKPEFSLLGLGANPQAPFPGNYDMSPGWSGVQGINEREISYLLQPTASIVEMGPREDASEGRIYMYCNQN